MSKYIEQCGTVDEIIKTDPITIGDNLRNAKNELLIDKKKYQELEYTSDYMNNLLNTIETVNNNWNNLVNVAINYQDNINYKDEVNYQGVNNSIEYNPESITTKGTVNTSSDYLNVRSTPNGEIISALPPGSEITILEGDKDGWTKISIGGKEAYVCSRYVTTNTPLEVIDTKSVSYSSLNVRNFPSGDIISTIPSNTEVQILANDSNGWTKILYGGKIAFVKSEGIN